MFWADCTQNSGINSCDLREVYLGFFWSTWDLYLLSRYCKAENRFQQKAGSMKSFEKA